MPEIRENPRQTAALNDVSKKLKETEIINELINAAGNKDVTVSLKGRTKKNITVPESQVSSLLRFLNAWKIYNVKAVNADCRKFKIILSNEEKMILEGNGNGGSADSPHVDAVEEDYTHSTAGSQPEETD